MKLMKEQRIENVKEIQLTGELGFCNICSLKLHLIAFKM